MKINKLHKSKVLINLAFISMIISMANPYANAQVYRCKSGNSMVIQDQPCPGSIRRSQDMPSGNTPSKQAPDPSDDIKERTSRDKAWLAERAALREKNEAKAKIESCDADTTAMQFQINQVSEQQPTNMGPSTRGILAMQLEEQRRQTIIAGLQSKLNAHKAECDGERRDFELKYKK